MSKMPEPPVTEIVMLREAVQGMTLRCLKAEARVDELEAENDHMRGIFKDLSDWLNNGAIIKATDPALPVVIGPELTTNLHIQGPLAGKEAE